MLRDQKGLEGSVLGGCCCLILRYNVAVRFQGDVVPTWVGQESLRYREESRDGPRCGLSLHVAAANHIGCYMLTSCLAVGRR